MQLIAAWPLPVGYLASPSMRSGVDSRSDREWLASGIQALSLLSDDQEVGQEAALRRGVVRFLVGDESLAIGDFQAATSGREERIRSLAHLMLGTIARRTARMEDALEHFREAHRAVPSQTATVALAEAIRAGGGTAGEAAVLMGGSLQYPVKDPWQLYSQRDHWYYAEWLKDLRREAIR